MSPSRYVHRGTQLFLVLAILLTHAPAAFADHPGADLDKIMGSKEKFFQSIDRKSPDFILRDARGQVVKLDSLREKVVILNFIYTKCPDICPLHTEYLSKVQSMINQTPMKDMVRFVSITTDPVNDTADALKAYGAVHGANTFNWSFLTTARGQPEDTTRKLAEAFGHKFSKTGDDYQAHSVVTHVNGIAVYSRADVEIECAKVHLCQNVKITVNGGAVDDSISGLADIKSIWGVQTFDVATHYSTFSVSDFGDSSALTLPPFVVDIPGTNTLLPYVGHIVVAVGGLRKN